MSPYSGWLLLLIFSTIMARASAVSCDRPAFIAGEQGVM
jgi:hypothetical protein